MNDKQIFNLMFFFMVFYNAVYIYSFVVEPESSQVCLKIYHFRFGRAVYQDSLAV